MYLYYIDSKNNQIDIIDSKTGKAIGQAQYINNPTEHVVLLSGLKLNVQYEAYDDIARTVLKELSDKFKAEYSVKLFSMLDRSFNKAAVALGFQPKNDRVMVRLKAMIPPVTADMSGITVITDKSVLKSRHAELAKLLKDNAYWAEKIDRDHVEGSIDDATISLAFQSNGKLIGCVNYLSNGDVVYVYDMVIDKSERHQGYGTALMAELNKQISPTETLLLIVARKADLQENAKGYNDDGYHHAPRIYRKFGFEKTASCDYGQGPVFLFNYMPKVPKPEPVDIPVASP